MLSMKARAMVASIHAVRMGMPKKKMTMPTFLANSSTARTMCCTCAHVALGEHGQHACRGLDTRAT